MPRNNAIIYIVLLGLFVFIYLGGAELLMPQCVEGDAVPSYCEDGNAFKKTCSGNKWRIERIEECSDNCEFGACLDTDCNGFLTKYICRTPYSAIKQTCSGGTFNNELIFCDQDEYCRDAAGCADSPFSCGNEICDMGENDVNCYRDCGAISSWDQYFLNLPSGILENYTQCTGMFDCYSPQVEAAVIEMESSCSFSNPKEWIECASQYVFNKVDYNFAGGNMQCDESATDILESKIGNCVDMSTLFIAMARYKKIPARHIGLCLSHTIDWRCQTYSLTGIDVPVTEVPLEIGHINGLTGDEYGSQPLGHAVAEVYNPVAGGWSIVDPTFNGLGLAKECYGYSPTLEYNGENGQVCFISSYQDNLFCKSF